jgi:hypothetical protein
MELRTFAEYTISNQAPLPNRWNSTIIWVDFSCVYLQSKLYETLRLRYIHAIKLHKYLLYMYIQYEPVYGIHNIALRGLSGEI